MSGHAEISEEPARLREINSRLAVVTLPPELLSEIFLECINRGALDRFNPHFSVASLRRTRSSLAGVCYRWRQVAQTTKSLWAVTAFPGNITNVWSDENGGSYEIPPPTHKLFHHELQLSDPTPLALVSHSIITVLPPPYMISTVKRDLVRSYLPCLHDAIASFWQLRAISPSLF
ncbi:hypothetical protein DL93DRAFT_1764656 [Clavulina sp. PMI_390]|nr:hypothetical protein DL93DRAFT_1764656 [Clavulina sp. PMI_390]